MKERTSSGLEEDIKRQVQLLIVKEAEIESLKKQVKKYKDQMTESNEFDLSRKQL